MTAIIDTNHDTTRHLPTLKGASVKTIIRYLSPINPAGEKCVKVSEARAIAAAGLRLGLVCEGWGDFAHGGISAGAGERDGEWCARYAPQVGVPENACIYFAVDVDASAGQIRKLVIPYFAAVAATFKQFAPKLRVGVYGSGAVCDAVVAVKLADVAWLSCSIGWAGSRDFLASNKWALRQHLPLPIAGIDSDPDDANGDFGDFVPFANNVIAQYSEKMGVATQAEYTVAANAIVKIINADIDADVPGWARGMIPGDMAPKLAGACAKAGIDAVDAYRAAHAPNPAPTPAT